MHNNRGNSENRMVVGALNFPRPLFTDMQGENAIGDRWPVSVTVGENVNRKWRDY